MQLGNFGGALQQVTVMTSDEHRYRRRLQLPYDLLFCMVVEVVGWLIQDDEVGFAGEQSGQRYSDCFTAGKRIQVSTQRQVEAVRGQGGGDLCGNIPTVTDGFEKLGIELPGLHRCNCVESLSSAKNISHGVVRLQHEVLR